MYAGNINQWKAEAASLPEILRPYIKKLAYLDKDSLEVGHHQIDDVNYYNVDVAVTEPAACRLLEAHRQYIDIQFVISGSEYIGWQPLADCGKVIEEHPDRDIWFYDGPIEKDGAIMMIPGTYAVFFPFDAHRPLCAPNGQCGPVRKIILKIYVGDMEEDTDEWMF